MAFLASLMYDGKILIKTFRWEKGWSMLRMHLLHTEYNLVIHCSVLGMYIV